MKKFRFLILGFVLCCAMFLFTGCTEVQVASTVRIENAEGKGNVVFDLPIDYSDGNAYYLPNGTEGLKNAVSKVVADLGVTAEVTADTEYLVGDGGQTTELDHVYVKIEFKDLKEYNDIMKVLAGDLATFPESELYYDEAEGGYVFKEHSTVLTNIVINLREIVCADSENVNLAPEGQDKHTPDEAANSWEQYIYVGNGTSEYFPHYDYRNEAIGHTFMLSIGNFVETDAPTEAPTETPTEAPTEAPTETPTEAPTEVPTEAPTEAPSDEEPDDGIPAGVIIAVVAVAAVAVALAVVASKKKKA